MRFDVHTVRCHLVNELMQAPQVREVWHDGSDVVILDFKSGESVSIHMVERFMSLDEIEYIFSHNAEQERYTMLLLWCDMFMPSHGQHYVADDWMLALLNLFNGKIYAYDAWRDAPYIFNVEFTPIPGKRQFLVKHGADVNIGKIGIDTIETTMPHFNGFWKVARFDGYNATSANADQEYWAGAGQGIGTNTSVRYYFNLLGLTLKANREDVKRAYRDLARVHHPDMNPNTDTTNRMQQINDAYTRVMRYLEADDTSTQAS